MKARRKGGGVCLLPPSWGSALKAKPPYPIRAAPEATLSQIHVANLPKIRSLTVRTVRDNTFCLAQVALFIYIELFCLWPGINKFTKKIRKPNAVDNNELMDFLSRIPSDVEVVRWITPSLWNHCSAIVQQSAKNCGSRKKNPPWNKYHEI